MAYGEDLKSPPHSVLFTMYPNTITVRENLARASPTFAGSLFTTTRPPAEQKLSPSFIYYFHDLNPFSIESNGAKTLGSPLTHNRAKLQSLIVDEPAMVQDQPQYLAWLSKIFQAVPLSTQETTNDDMMEELPEQVVECTTAERDGARLYTLVPCGEGTVRAVGLCISRLNAKAWEEESSVWPIGGGHGNSQTQAEEGALYLAVKQLINTCRIAQCRFGWIQSEDCTLFLSHLWLELCRTYSETSRDRPGVEDHSQGEHEACGLVLGFCNSRLEPAVNQARRISGLVSTKIPVPGQVCFAFGV